MAKQFIDASVSDTKEGLAQQDGTSLTLTNSVRVLYDDTLTTTELYVTLTRIRDKIAELES